MYIYRVLNPLECAHRSASSSVLAYEQATEVQWLGHIEHSHMCEDRVYLMQPKLTGPMPLLPWIAHGLVSSPAELNAAYVEQMSY